MKTHATTPIAVLTFLALASTLLVSSASARPPRTNFFARPPAPVQQQVIATPDATAAQRNSTWTNADGQTVTHEATSVQDTTRAGTLAGPVQTTTVTGPNGQTATVARTISNADGSITVITTNTDGSVIRATSVTGPNKVIPTTKVITSKDGDIMTLTTTSP